MTKPIIGQAGWGQVLNDHLDAIEAKADSKETPAGAQDKANAAEANAKAASIPSASREAASGVAGLDASGKLFESRLPDRLSDATLASSSAADRSRANHTGTQSAATVEGLAAVATSGLKADVGLGLVDNTSDADKPVSLAQQSALDAKAAKAANLSDLASPATARTNLGLGGAATLNVGTTAGTVAAGDDSRFGAGGLSPGYKAGQWIIPPAVAVTTLADNGENGYYIPLLLAVETAINAIAIELTAAGGVGKVKRLGAYSAGADGMPSTLLFDAGLTGAQVSGLQALAVAHTLPAGLVWLYIQGQSDGGAGARPTHRAMTACAFPHAQQPSYAGTDFNGYYTLNGPNLSTSALPATPPAISGLAGSGTPFVVVRKA